MTQDARFPAQSDGIAAVHLRSRASAMPWLAVVHTPVETRWWVEHVLLVEHEVRVIEVDGVVAAYAALRGDELTGLYVDPDNQGRGHGRGLLAEAQRQRPDGLRLHVFARNTRAQRFYAAAGFTVVGRGDGSGNEEREPDVVMRWTAPQDPSAP